MANWISYIKDDLGSGDDTRDGMITNGPTHGVQLSQELPPLVGFTTIASTGTLEIKGTLKLDGQLKDGDDDFGTSGQVLSSDGTDTKWVSSGSLAAGAASQVAINDDGNTNAARFLTFVDSSSGNNNVKTDTQLTYNPSTNVISTSGVDVTDNSKIRFGNGNDLHISHTNDLSGQADSNGDDILAGDDWCSFIKETGSGPLIFKSNGGPSTGAYQFYDTGWRPILKLFSGTSARAALYYAGSEKLITSSTGITVTGTAAATAFSGPLTGNVTGNADTATALATARNIGGVSFNGTAAINLPGVNQSGNQDTSGNAASATVLASSRNFSISGEITANAVSFNGNGNVELSATIDNNIVDEANLKISNTGTNGQFLCKRSGNTGGMTWETVSNAASALSGGTLASGITNSSLTSLGTLTALTVANDISVDSVATIGQSNNTRNLKIQAIGSGTDIGISGYDSAGNWRYQLYGSATGGYGFLTSNWGSWDIRKIVNGEMRLRVGGSDYIVWHQGNDGDSSGLAAETAARLSTTRSIGGVNFDGSGNINLPGVNTAGNQDTSGNAATATEVYVTQTNDNSSAHAVVFTDESVSSSSGNKGLQYDNQTFWFHPSENKMTVQNAFIPNLDVTNLNILPSGTRMIFQQTSAPTGWTKDTSAVNQRALRVVSGTAGSGGSVDFSTAFSSSRATSGGNPLALTLSTNQIPSHRHWISGAPKDDNNFSTAGTNTQEHGLYADAGSYSASDQNRSYGRNSAYTGGGQAHDHGFTQATVNLNVRYLDVIIAEKD